MSHPISSDLLRLFGPCRVLHAGASDTGILLDLLLRGCDAWCWRDGAVLPHPRFLERDKPNADFPSLDVILVEIEPGQEAANALTKLFRRFGTPRGLALRAPGQNRRRIEDALFATGWRRHPADLTAAQYGQLDDTRLGELACYERIPASALGCWSVADLQADRPLHMDMLREGGCRADAHIARYALAAQIVRPGDTVLDCACGLGYGTAVLASLSRGGRFIGIDTDAGAIAYAQANYPGPDIAFLSGDAGSLATIPDASVDVVVSMETIEHVADWQGALRTFRRVLKPDGRLIASVPDRWVDETGNDPNPHHFQAFDWEKFSAELAEHFIVEKRFTQTAPGGFKLPLARRVLAEVPMNADLQAEWILAVASVNPLENGRERRDDFRHPAFGSALDASGAAVVDFVRGYDNPYLYRPLVQMGERIGDDDRLARLAELAMTLSKPGSADQGAAICVLGYRVLEVRNADVAKQMLDIIAAYLEESSDSKDNPHVVRWRLSLMFLAGRLAELNGDIDTAIRWFRMASYGDWSLFSPLIATKVVAAAVHEGALHLARGDDDAARECFARGLNRSLESIRGDLAEVVGCETRPIPFGLQELAEVADMGSQCANAIACLPLLARDRGLFWRQIDIKRFGVASWARDVERANAHLIGRVRALEKAAARKKALPVI